MKKHKRHKTVIELAQESRQLPLVDSLEHLSPENRVKKMEEFFLAAVSAEYEEIAALYLELLLKSIEDQYIAPYLEKRGDGYYYDENLFKAKNELFVAVLVCDRKAMELYRSLPKVARKERCGPTVDSPFEERDPDQPALFEVKKSILNRIATAWRKTEYEANADEYFSFLHQSVLEYVSSDDRNFKQDLIKKATGKDFPLTRLARHYCQMVLTEGFDGSSSRFDDYEKSVAQIISNGIFRIAGWRKITGMLSAFSGMLVYDDLKDRLLQKAVFDLAGKELEQVAETGRAVQELLKALGDKPASLLVERFESINLSSNRRIVLLIKDSCTLKNEVDERARYKRLLENVGPIVVAWREKYPQYTVKFMVQVCNKLGHHELLFDEEKTFE